MTSDKDKVTHLTGRSHTTVEEELKSIEAMLMILEPMDSVARSRVMRYLLSRYMNTDGSWR